MLLARQRGSPRTRRVSRWLVLVALLSGCSVSGPSSTERFQYPLGVGNRWEYEREFWMSEIEPVKRTSDWPPWVSTSHVEVWIEREVVLRETVLAAQMYETITDDVGTYESGHFYAHGHDGTYMHAYIPGSSAAAPKPAVGSEFWFGGARVSGLTDILRLAQGEALLADSLRETILYDEPLLAFPRPMRVGDQWTIRDSDEYWRVDKRVAGFEKVEVPAGTFYCYVVEWLIDFDDDGEWDEDSRFTDYVSRLGLIRRDRWAELIAMSAEGETLGVFETGEVSELTSLGVSLGPVGQAN